MTVLERPESDDSLVRRIETVIPLREGEDGLYTQTWYPICLSEELTAGQVQSRPFLDGKVVAYRGEDGAARVMSGYCPHMGGDLEDAKVVSDRLQCPWHKFEFDHAGLCQKTGIGDRPPRTARLFAFPTAEKYGLIWAFNGETPLFDIPSFPADKKDLMIVTRRFPVDFGDLEPWQMLGQIPDVTHFITLHNMTFNDPKPWDTVQWTPFSMSYDISAQRDGIPVNLHQEIWGTNILFLNGDLDGRWYSWLSPGTLGGSGMANGYSIMATERLTDEQEAMDFLDAVEKFNIAIGSEDVPITQKMHLRVGALTKSDHLVYRYYSDYLANYPRAHPAAGMLY